MSSQFVVNSFNPGTSPAASTLGFGLLGLDSGFTGTLVSNAYYLADFGYGYSSSGSPKGGLRILALGDTSGFTSSSTSNNFNGNTTNLAIVVGTTYTLKLTGTYGVGGELDLSFGLFDSTGTTQYGNSATGTDTSPLVGTNFGYRNRNGSNSGTAASLNASFDNFSVANVPEPSSALLGLSGALAFLLRRRR
jgi:MYXO-CTERM domain-containing protein